MGRVEILSLEILPVRHIIIDILVENLGLEGREFMPHEQTTGDGGLLSFFLAT